MAPVGVRAPLELSEEPSNWGGCPGAFARSDTAAVSGGRQAGTSSPNKLACPKVRPERIQNFPAANHSILHPERRPGLPRPQLCFADAGVRDSAVRARVSTVETALTVRVAAQPRKAAKDDPERTAELDKQLCSVVKGYFQCSLE